jgi:hypothetical protein
MQPASEGNEGKRGVVEIPGRSTLRPGFRHRSESLPLLFCRRLLPKPGDAAFLLSDKRAGIQLT